MATHHLLAALLVGCSAYGAMACSIARPTLADALRNARVKQNPDCSFVNKGFYDEDSGDPAKDLGDGRVLQMITYDEAILLDCRTGESLVVIGKKDPIETSCGPVYNLRDNLTPGGPLDLEKWSDLAEFIENVSRLGIETYRDANILNRGEKRKDRFDPFCGCKLFYPDLAEASQ